MSPQKVAIITGASRGIGKTVATGLAQMGYQLVLISRSEQTLIALSEELKTLPPQQIQPVIFGFDLTDSEKTKSAIKMVKEKFGRIDLLFNNAGIFYDGTLSLSEEDFKAMLNTNLMAQFVITQEVVPIMKKQKSGYILNLVSRSGKIGFAGSGGYSASKFAMSGLNESLYRELAEFGISVTAICPGWVDTEMAFAAGTPLKSEEMIQPSDIMKTIKMLLNLSPSARIKEIIIEPAKSIV